MIGVRYLLPCANKLLCKSFGEFDNNPPIGLISNFIECNYQP